MMTFHFSNHVELLFSGLITHTPGGQNFSFAPLVPLPLTHMTCPSKKPTMREKKTRNEPLSNKSSIYLELLPAAMGQQAGWHPGWVASLLPRNTQFPFSWQRVGEPKERTDLELRNSQESTWHNLRAVMWRPLCHNEMFLLYCLNQKVDVWNRLSETHLLDTGRSN